VAALQASESPAFEFKLVFLEYFYIIFTGMRSANLDFENLKPFTTECQIAGLFFFVPYIIESGILSV